AFTSKFHDPPDDSTGSPKSLKLVKEWLDTCIEEHPRCASFCGTRSLPLPTRVIDVGSATSNKDPVLLVSNGISAPYVALSHCWGDSMVAKTTSANYLQLQQGIPFQSLPRNFRDAVTITRSLGCRYLWIDALCIIQDSSDDWDMESSRMHLVYRNALLTIFAARSEDAEGGCFVTRNAALHRPTALTWKGTQQGEMFWRIRKNASQAKPHKGLLKASGPLYHRAWVLQEQGLSGRQVAYCAGTMFWSCISRESSEGFSVQLFQNVLVNTTQPEILFFRLKEDHPQRLRMYNFWYHMLAEYCRRDLKYVSDKLPAISALAEEMSHVLLDTYVAGLWRKNMFRGLLWHTARYRGRRLGPRVCPPRHFVAPSWSWASIDG
ncbi:HET-domain-containing protein, partial [Coniochaeta ligniaria NRRL 30616]